MSSPFFYHTSVALAKKVYKGTIFAFEPQNIIFQTLCANLSLNSITNCITSKYALSDSNTKTLYLPSIDYSIPENFGGVKLSDKKFDLNSRVDVETLDNIFGDLMKLKILKVDVEGRELNVFKGGEELIKRTSPIIYFENDTYH